MLSLGFGVWGLQGYLAHKPAPPPQELGVLMFGFWVWKLGLRVEGLGFADWGWGVVFKVWCLGFMVKCLGQGPARGWRVLMIAIPL